MIKRFIKVCAWAFSSVSALFFPQALSLRRPTQSSLTLLRSVNGLCVMLLEKKGLYARSRNFMAFLYNISNFLSFPMVFSFFRKKSHFEPANGLTDKILSNAVIFASSLNDACAFVQISTPFFWYSFLGFSFSKEKRCLGYPRINL